jgi:hypothetical protein
MKSSRDAAHREQPLDIFIVAKVMICGAELEPVFLPFVHDGIGTEAHYRAWQRLAVQHAAS